MRSGLVFAVAVIAIAGSGFCPGRLNAKARRTNDLAESSGARAKTAKVASREDAGKGMALIPGGTFEMGIAEADLARLEEFFQMKGRQLFEPELPKHSVTVNGFWMDRNLVTNAQFKEFVERHPEWRAGRISQGLHNGHYLEHWKGGEVKPEIAQYPVANVSWYAAVAYCQAEGKRLPTEAEWEFAAKGNRNGIFPWGNEPADKTRANYSNSGLGTPSKVGSYPGNGFGLFDMAGNVWEYLADEWAPYRAGTQKNPIAGSDLFDQGDTFLKVKSRRVIRGGSFGGAPINMWVEYRDSHPPENAKEFVGFRCAKTVPEQ